jgi:subtilisin family serine protease
MKKSYKKAFALLAILPLAFTPMFAADTSTEKPDKPAFVPSDPPDDVVERVNEFCNDKSLRKKIDAKVGAALKEAKGAPRFTDAQKARIDAFRKEHFKGPMGDLKECPRGMKVTRSERVHPTDAQRDEMRKDMKTASANKSDTIEGRYIVMFKEDTFPYALPKDGNKPTERVRSNGRTLNDEARAIVKDAGGEIYRTWNEAIPGFAAKLTDDQVETLKANPDIESVEPDGVMSIETDEAASMYWGLDRIDERNDTKSTDENVYRYMTTGDGVHVYVIDTGIRSSHTQFSNITFGTGFFAETNNSSNSYVDAIGHGTHVAGIICGKNVGVAKDVTLHSVRVSSASSWATSATIECVEWITSHHTSGEPAVVNMSLGGSGYSSSLYTAISNLISDGVVVVVASGNNTANLNTTNYSPASFSNVITVGATRSDDHTMYVTGSDGTIYQSNYGNVVDIWAPGEAIFSSYYSTDSSYTMLSGTSMACPFVTGIVARYLEDNPTASQSAVETYLKGTASKNKITGLIGTGPNNLLFMNGWFYPLHTALEFANSDATENGGYWMWSDGMWSWIWTSFQNGWAHWIYRASDGAYLYFYESTDDLYLAFANCSEDGYPIEIYQEQ